MRTYWDTYEAVGLHRYRDFSYYERMWSWHRAMVDAISAGQYGEGKQILIRHFTLLSDRLQGSQDGLQAGGLPASGPPAHGIP